MKRGKITGILCLLLCFVLILPYGPGMAAASDEESIAPEIQWRSTASTPGFDYAADIRQTSDGGYILAGSDETDKKAILVKMTDAGGIEWFQQYRGDLGDTVQTAESVCENVYGYVFTGYKKINNKDQVYITQVDHNGGSVWTKTYGDTWAGNISRGHSIQRTTDGGLVVTGSLAAPEIADGYNNIYLLKTDASGEMVWETVAGGGDEKYDYIGNYVQPRTGTISSPAPGLTGQRTPTGNRLRCPSPACTGSPPGALCYGRGLTEDSAMITKILLTASGRRTTGVIF